MKIVITKVELLKDNVLRREMLKYTNLDKVVFDRANN
jgi:hypothetical protein